MANPIVKNNSFVGVEEEVTEGVFVAPSAATSFVQPQEDGFSLTPARELVERTTLNASPGRETPRLGIRSVAAQLPVEFRGSGVEGGAPDFDALLRAALGDSRSAAASTTKAGNSATVLQIEDADISKYSVGDIVVVEESGAYEMRPISAVDPSGGAANITLAFALANGAPADNVVVSAFQTYLTAASGHPTLSLAYYWANEIRQSAAGCRVTSMSLDNYTTGQLALFNFGMEGLSYDEIDGAAPFTPVFDSETPPILLDACVFRNGVALDMNTLALSLANTLGYTTNLCDANGRTSSRIVSREITGSINPYKDDASTAFFDGWNDGTEFSLFARAFNPSGVSGEWDKGSIVGIWLPQCFATEFSTQDAEGLLVDQIGFRATRGVDGSSEEMFIGMV